MLDICTLGTCGMMPLPGRWLSCVLLRYGSTLTLFDCGEGTQIPWKSLGWGLPAWGYLLFAHARRSRRGLTRCSLHGSPRGTYRAIGHLWASRDDLRCRWAATHCPRATISRTDTRIEE